MDHEHPFIHEVRANPHDDHPRLIFADYLEETGDPRAGLIRVQVELSHLPPGDPARRELELEEQELLDEFADEWLEPLRALGVEGVSARSLQRGLIERVRVQATAFLEHGEVLCRQSPALYCIELRGVAEQMQRLVSHPPPVQVTSLDLSSNRLSARELQLLAAAAWREQLTSLSLAFNQLDDSAVQALAAVDWPNLEELNLSVNRIGAEGIGALMRRPAVPKLTTLWLGLNKIGNSGVEHLVRSSVAGSLRLLDLSSTNLTGVGLAQLVASPAAQSLERLMLRGNRLYGNARDRYNFRVATTAEKQPTEQALAALASAPRLKYLDLRGTECREPPPELMQRLGDGLLY